MKNTKLGSTANIIAVRIKTFFLRLRIDIMETKTAKDLHVLRMHRKAEREKRLRTAYLSYFEQNCTTADIVSGLQGHLAKTSENKPAFQAAIETLAKRGDYNLVAKSLEGMSWIHPSILATIKRYQKECAVLSAYTEALNTQRAMQTTKPGSVEKFISLEDFILGGYLDNEEVAVDFLSECAIDSEFKGNPIDIVQDRSTFETLVSSCVVGSRPVQASKLINLFLISRVPDSAIATQSASTFEYVLDVLQRNMHRAITDYPQSLLGGFSVAQLRAASGRMGGRQLASCIKLLTGGIYFYEDGAHFSGNSGAQFFEQNKEAIRLNIQAYLSRMSSKEFVEMKSSTFMTILRTLNYMDGINGGGELDGMRDDVRKWLLEGPAMKLRESQTATSKLASMDPIIIEKLGIQY